MNIASMSIGLGEDLADLASTVARWVRRVAPLEQTREHLDDHGAGAMSSTWQALVEQGLHALHLPEEFGGADAGLEAVAVAAEELARALFPGPFLPTVTASGVLALAPASPVRDALLSRMVEGATGVVVSDPQIRAQRRGDEWVVTGVSGEVVGLPGAEICLVRALVADAPAGGVELWFVCDVTAGTTGVEPLPPTDLTRSVGRLSLDAHVVTETFTGPAAHEVELLGAALSAAEASGVASWCVATGVEYVRTREQFGVAVGSFQAVQHRAAMMLVHSEIIRAAAWDATRAVGDSVEQQQLAAAQIGAAALPAALDVAVDCVQIMGGIGFTWEHDTHLYWRRAISLQGAAGAQAHWTRRLGELSVDASRDFVLVDDTTRPDVAAEVGDVLDRVVALPTEGQTPATAWAPARGGARQRLLADSGLVAPHYPSPFGRAAGVEEQAVIAREFARRDLPVPSTVIGEWVLPTLLEHGTSAQQARFVMPTLRGEILWCQLFSEPGAGSDLASLSTRARKVEGGWVLTGQKVWTSMAAEADWGVCLARTDADAPKHAGISYFLIDLRSPGVDVRPVRQATGLQEFNEVFLSDVHVPDDCLVAQPGDGWRLAGTTLANERLKMGASLGHGAAERVRDVLRDERSTTSRSDVVAVLGECTSREMSLEALNLRAALHQRDGREPGAAISVQKVFNAIAQRENSRALLTVLGPRATVALPPEGDGARATDGVVDPVIDHLGLPAVLFGGGTVEIQLNVIARRVLRLPR